MRQQLFIFKILIVFEQSKAKTVKHLFLKRVSHTSVRRTFVQNSLFTKYFQSNVKVFSNQILSSLFWFKAKFWKFVLVTPTFLLKNANLVGPLFQGGDMSGYWWKNNLNSMFAFVVQSDFWFLFLETVALFEIRGERFSKKKGEFIKKSGEVT